jgi:hypothetical protein
MVPTRSAFSAKAGTGLAKDPQGRVSEDAIKQQDRAFSRFSQIGGCPGGAVGVRRIVFTSHAEARDADGGRR